MGNSSFSAVKNKKIDQQDENYCDEVNARHAT